MRASHQEAGQPSSFRKKGGRTGKGLSSFKPLKTLWFFFLWIYGHCAKFLKDSSYIDSQLQILWLFYHEMVELKGVSSKVCYSLVITREPVFSLMKRMSLGKQRRALIFADYPAAFGATGHSLMCPPSLPSWPLLSCFLFLRFLLLGYSSPEGYFLTS